MTPKTIQIFLPGGDPQGIRVAELTTRIMQVIEVPRSLLSSFLAMPESNQVALYFLVGESEDDNGNQRVYIGQTGDLRARLTNHHQNREFWQRALVVISRTNSLTQTHSVYLEWHCIKAIREAGRYADENGNAGSRPHTPPPLEADCFEIYDTAKTLLATLGYPLFEPVVRPTDSAPDSEVYYCRASGADGRGLYTPEGFVVLKGSLAKSEGSDSMGKGTAAFREHGLQAGTLVRQGDKLVFQKDELFNTPSAAARAILGRSAGGWVEWVNADGMMLKEVESKP